jgi:hypothetical protein
VYLFLKLYFSGAGTAEAEAIIYKDQAMTEGIGAMRLPDYTFEQLGANPLDTLHTLTIANLAQDGATLTIVNPLINANDNAEQTPE